MKQKINALKHGFKSEKISSYYECHQYVDLLKKIREEIVNVRPHPRIRNKISENNP